MPKESLSVYLTAVDGISPVFAAIADKTRALDKESQELAETYEALQKANKGLIEQKTGLQKKLQEVNEEVKAARKQFKELGDEASSDALNKATEKQQALRNEIAGTTKALQENQKIYRENIEIARKNALGGESRGLDLSAIWGGLGIGEEVSSLVGRAGGVLLSSALGSDMGSMASNALSSAITGASLGTAIAPGIGTAIGAALGGLSGLAGSAIEQWGNEDAAFKDYYGGLYDDVKGRSGEMVEAGSTIAGGREQTRMAFAKRLGGEDRAAAYLDQVEKMAASTNYEYDEIVGYAKLLLNSYDPDEVFGVLRDLSDATAGLDLSSSDVNMMISGLSRMRTTGKATQEYLNYFRERGVDVDQDLADSLGVEKSSVSEMVTKGKISGEDAAQAVLDFIQQEFGGLSDDLASTYDAMVDNLGDVTSSIQAAGGDAYNELRKSGVSAQQEAYEGELGEALKEINAIMGENQARKENLQDQYMREVLDAVLNGNQGSLWSAFDESQQQRLTEMSEQYASLMDRYQNGDTNAGAGLESLYEQAQALGQAYFDNSEFVQTLNDVEREEIEAIREATAGLDGATQAAYRLSEELSKGRAAADIAPANMGGWERQADGTYKPTYSTGFPFTMNTVAESAARLEASRPSSHAFGLARVPYNGYPALLHADERVLTAAEARAQDAGQDGRGPVTVTITGNSFTGLPEDMADQLAEIILRKLRQEATAAAPK